MSVHTSQVFDYLDTHPVNQHDGDFTSVLEMLHYIYTSSNPIDNEHLRNHFQKVRYILDTLSKEDADTLFSVMCDLYYELEKTAFSHGITVGMHLMTEVNTLP